MAPRSPRPAARANRPRNSRPTSRSTAAGRTRAQAAKPKTRFTGRMAVLVIVAAVLVVSYASSLRAYLDQRSQLGELRQEIATAKGDLSKLRTEKARWKDDRYVVAQARERLGWVLPGETSYQVLDASGKPLAGQERLTDPKTIGRELPKPWWSKANASLQAADHPAKKPQVLTHITNGNDKRGSGGNRGS